MLNQYLQRTQLLLTDMKQEMLNPAFLTNFINTARGQLAGEAECIRAFGTVSTVVGQNTYLFSSLALLDVGSQNLSGAQGALHVRSIRYAVGDGSLWITPRPWEWFNFYEISKAASPSGAPESWSQYGQGVGGGFIISPLPDFVYTLLCDAVCYPIPLVNDTTVEVIPYLWTDAVPYFAAYLAYLYVQNNGAAKNMMEMYQMFVKRARSAANPAPGSWQYEQADDPAQLSKFAKPGGAA